MINLDIFGFLRPIYKKGNRVYDANEAFFEARKRVMNKSSVLDGNGERILLLITENISEKDSSRLWRNASPVFCSRVRRGYITFQDLGFTQHDIGKFIRHGLVTNDFQKSLENASNVWNKTYWDAEEMEDCDTVKLSARLEPPNPAITACLP